MGTMLRLDMVVAGLQPAYRTVGVAIRAIAALNAPQGSPRTLKRCAYQLSVPDIRKPLLIEHIYHLLLV
jgi:hypothetical protein